MRLKKPSKRICDTLSLPFYSLCAELPPPLLSIRRSCSMNLYKSKNKSANCIETREQMLKWLQDTYLLLHARIDNAPRSFSLPFQVLPLRPLIRIVVNEFRASSVIWDPSFKATVVTALAACALMVQEADSSPVANLSTITFKFWFIPISVPGTISPHNSVHNSIVLSLPEIRFNKRN